MKDLGVVDGCKYESNKHLPQCISKNSYKIKFKVVKLTIDKRSFGSLMHTSCSKQLSYSFLGLFRHFFMLPPILVNSTNDRSPEFWPLTSNDLRLASNFACSVESGANLCIPNFIKFREKKISGLVWFVLIIKVDLPIPLYKVIN